MRKELSRLLLLLLPPDIVNVLKCFVGNMLLDKLLLLLCCGIVNTLWVPCQQE
jgi:hypothetical protein